NPFYNTTTDNVEDNLNDNHYWWEALSDMYKNTQPNEYTPKNLIPPLHPLPFALLNLYMSNSQENFSHLSRQYNSLFSFTTLGYTGGVAHLQHPHAFAVNGHAYYQIHSANTMDTVNLIEQELATINPFIQGLYRLHDTNYPQARLIIQQPTANIKIAACVIVHSTAVVQERCIQIWHMFSRAEDEQLQFIRKEQYRFRKGGQEEDESLSDKAELYPEGIYLPASHTLSFRWSYKKTMDALAICTQRCIRHNKCYWNYLQLRQKNTIINELGYINYQRHTENDINVVPYNALLLLKLKSHINVEVAPTSYIIFYLYKYIYKGPDHATVNIYIEDEPEIIDEINDYLNACYLSAIEA
ncbi:5446_t:CDS:2, partial [Gigaspora margarita]